MITRIGIVGCGYVFDHYMSTLHRHPGLEIAAITDRDPDALARATSFWKLPGKPDLDSLLQDDTITLIVNLTSIESHAEVTRAALEAGRHVYCEKPFVTDMDTARALVDLAQSRGLRIGCAPSNALSPTSLTMARAVADGAAGDVRLVYAEFDDNPIYLMSPEGWRSRSGAPWPYLHEYEMGCTWEHVGYHLAWMCAIFGPVRTVTAFSRQTLPDKTDQPLNPSDTPDFSVACLDFASGVVGRVTCSIAVPYDHRMRIIGNRGMIHADTYRHYECPVHIEPFTKLSMNARKARSVRTRSWLGALFGVGGRRVPLVRLPMPGRQDGPPPLVAAGWSPKAALRRWRQREVGQQDKTIGIAELAAAIHEDRPHFPSHEMTLHLTELTLAIQAAGADGATHQLQTGFATPALPQHLRDMLDRAAPDYSRYARPGIAARLSAGILDRMHR